MACQTCTKVRPDNFSAVLSNYHAQIDNYTQMIEEFTQLATDLKSEVVDKIDECGLPNLEIAVSSSDIESLTTNIKEYKTDMNNQCESYKEMAKEAANNRATLVAEKNNYLQTAWVEKCETVPCTGGNY